jgi:hypothetical protein
MLGFRSEPDKRRDSRVDRSLEFGHRRADRGSAAERFEIVGEPTAHALMGFVSVFATDNGSNHHGLIHPLSELREDLADLDTGNVRCDRTEFASDFRGSLRFDFPHVLVRGTATEENVDQTLVRALFTGLLFGTEQVGEGKPAKPKA